MTKIMLDNLYDEISNIKKGNSKISHIIKQKFDELFKQKSRPSMWGRVLSDDDLLEIKEAFTNWLIGQELLPEIIEIVDNFRKELI